MVTARHVVTGRDPFTDEVMSNKGFIPRFIRVFPTISHGNAGERAHGIKIDLELSENTSIWFGDPEFEEYRTDIAAIDIGIMDDRIICLNQPDMLFQPVLSIIGFECSILGYPSANTGGMQTPVWRRGTIASEPRLPVDGKPMFLIDASTSPGFSGAPVIRRHIGPAPFRKEDGTFEIKVENIVTVDFVGVYAGRLQNKHIGGELSFAFYANRLASIFAAL